MSKGLGILILIVGGLVGFSIGNLGGGEKMISEAPMSHTAHETLNIEENVPKVSLDILGNDKTGYDAKISLTNFKFAPENANGEYVEGEGHAHIYVDGEKINRVYGEWYHVGKLPVGSHEVEVRLSSNNHLELAENDEPIKANTMIVVRDSDLDIMDDHTHEDGVEDDHPHEE